ncbi:MAG: hypothetical protein AAF696_12525 [Bacteroidota bacterium]
MDWEEMQHTWQEMSELRREEHLVDEKYLRKLTHRKSLSGLYRIAIYELTGILVSLVMLSYLIFNFHKLNTWLDLLGGYGSLVILIFSLVLGARLIWRIFQIDIRRNSLSATLKDFSRFKKSLGFYKNMSVYISIILPFFMLPLLANFFFGKNILEEWENWLSALMYSFLLLPIIFYFIIRFYKRNIRQVNEALAEIEEPSDDYNF